MRFEELVDRVEGSLLGAAIGDALGSPFEFKTAAQIDAADIGGTGYDGRFTDDFEAIVAVSQATNRSDDDPVESLLSQAAWWGNEPHRGYGPSISKAFERLRSGTINCAGFASSVHPGGSYGNGALVRAVPAGLGWCLSGPCEAGRVARKLVGVTHGNPVSIDAGDAHATLLATLLTASATVLS
jgi:ADP-ribosylglycohydrolase